MWWPIGVCAIKDGDEVGFESLNCSFGQVPTVHAGVDKLVVKVLCFDTCNEIIGDFIVQSVEDGFDACICESLVACITASNQVVQLPAFDWFGWDGIGIAVMKNEEAAVSF